MLVTSSTSDIPESLLAFKSRISPVLGISVSIIIDSAGSVASDRLPAESRVLKVIRYGSTELARAVLIVIDSVSLSTNILSDSSPFTYKMRRSFNALVLATPDVRPEMLKVGVVSLV